MESTLKKMIAVAVLAMAPMMSFADTGLQHALSDSEMEQVTGQAGINITPAQIISGLQQTSGILNKLSPVLPSQGKAVVTIVNSAAQLAPVVNNLVNGAKPTAQDIQVIVVNGVKVAVAVSKLTSGL